jgi:hypothetical protein
MTPTELKVQALRRLDEAITKYMDSKINDFELSDLCIDVINEFIEQFGEL